MTEPWQVWCCGAVIMGGTPLGWQSITYIHYRTGRRERHAMPVGDMAAHTGPGCKCQPEYLEDQEVWAHNAYDCRDEYELGHRLLH